MLFRKNTAMRVPVRLVDGAGAPVTGVLVSDIKGGICTVVKADGTSADIALTLGTNFFEPSPSTKTQGLYHVLLPSGSFSVLGPIQWVILPAASLFSSAGYVGLGIVEDLPPLIMSYLVNSDGASPVHSVAAALRLITQYLSGLVKQDTATNQMTIYKEDNTTALSQRNTYDAAASPTSDPIYKVGP